MKATTFRNPDGLPYSLIVENVGRRPAELRAVNAAGEVLHVFRLVAGDVLQAGPLWCPRGRITLRAQPPRALKLRRLYLPGALPVG